MIAMIESSRKRLALVTGATSGIGAAFADRLARRGFDLVLHGRRRKELTERAETLRRSYGTAVEIILAELSEAEGMKEVEERIESLDRLDVLINNAGYWEPGFLWERSPDSLAAMITVHTIAPVRFIRAALPDMLRRKQGDIINVSSMGAYLNMATLENYAATKAYLISFSESLHVALMGTGIRVQVLIPGFTVTEFHSRLGADFSKEQEKWLKPGEVVDSSLRALEKGRVLCIPGVRRRLVARLVRALPRPMYYRMMSAVGRKTKKRWDEIEMSSR